MENFTGYVNLGEPSQHQEIYSTQLYGTFFGIFAKFDCDGDKSPEDYIFNDINLELINYKGICDIGITKAELKPIKDKSRFILKIEVQAMNGTTNCSVNCKNIKISKNGARILMDRRVKKIHLDESAHKDCLFDTEFFYREGIADDSNDLPFPKRTPTPLGWCDELPKEELDKFIDSVETIGGSKCPRRIVNVL